MCGVGRREFEEPGVSTPRAREARAWFFKFDFIVFLDYCYNHNS